MNQSKMIAALLGAVLLLSPALAPIAVQAQTSTKTKAGPTGSASSAKLPSVTKILADVAAAAGDKAAFTKIKTLVMRGTMTLSAQNLSGAMDIQMAFPDKIHVSQEIGGVGKFEQGYDGKQGWSRDPLNGLRTLAGAELGQMRRQADEVRSSDWHQLYSKAELIGLRKVGAESAYAVRLTPKRGGKPVIIYYDTRTKLPLRTDTIVETAQGAIPTQTFASDFRIVSGVMMPFKSRQVIGATEVSLLYDRIEFNAPINESVFAKPTAVTTVAKPEAPKPEAPKPVAP